LSRSHLAVRGRRGDWEAKGSRSFDESAEQKARGILAQEPKSYLNAHQQAELARIERHALGG
jgi:trimethylamine:corrinoid methyltransferase-like protein